MQISFSTEGKHILLSLLNQKFNIKLAWSIFAGLSFLLNLLNFNWKTFCVRKWKMTINLLCFHAVPCSINLLIEKLNYQGRIITKQFCKKRIYSNGYECPLSARIFAKIFQYPFNGRIIRTGRIVRILNSGMANFFGYRRGSREVVFPKLKMADFRQNMADFRQK